MEKRRMKAVDALKLGIERENGANKFYQKATQATRDQNGKNMFDWLAKEELRHLARLRQQMKSVLDNNKWLEWKRVTAPMNKTEFPSISEATGTTTIDASEMDALRQGIKSEQDAIAFYKDAEDSTPDLKGKNMFRALGKEEEGHLSLLEEELQWLTQSRKYFTVHRFQLRAD